MRLLVTVEGSPGRTRAAIQRIAYDEVRVLAVDPEDPELARVARLIEGSKARCTVTPVAADDLMAAFETVCAALDADGDASMERHVAVNAGADANLLSAAALLACLHTGAEAHFIHERGHDVLPVLTRAPLSALLSDGEAARLASFPDGGIAVAEAPQNDPRSLNALRKRDLIELLDGRLLLTGQGRSYRDHVRPR